MSAFCHFIRLAHTLNTVCRRRMQIIRRAKKGCQQRHPEVGNGIEDEACRKTNGLTQIYPTPRNETKTPLSIVNTLYGAESGGSGPGMHSQYAQNSNRDRKIEGQDNSAQRGCFYVAVTGPCRKTSCVKGGYSPVTIVVLCVPSRLKHWCCCHV